jgi:prepilin-type processing-associated H-X9-DG protein
VFNDGPDETLYEFDQTTKNGHNGAELLDYWRHDRKVNIVFLDGHADTIPMEDEAFKQVWTSRGTVH